MKRRSFLTAIVVSIPLVSVFQLPQPAVAAAVPRVGASAGTFAVDVNGGGVYTIPIRVAPGTAGKAPDVALTYSKSAPNSFVGAGFTVTGLSVVHRCAATIALDGVKGGVNYDGGDRFCVDGQRLIAVNGLPHRPPSRWRTYTGSCA